MAEPPHTDKLDVEALKRRGRRRLVGAIALVLAAVIVLPMVFDAEPKRVPPVSVRIPSEDDPAFTPKVVPKSPPAASEPAAKGQPAPKPDAKAPAKTEPKAEPAPEAKAPTRPEPKAVPKPEPRSAAVPVPPGQAERKRAELALAGGQYFVPVGAFSDAGKLNEVTERLSAAKMPFFTERIAIAKGTATRVRAGPFTSAEAAEQALTKLRALGFKPGKVATRP